ncbi:MAG: diguanylate cyclase, partial [Rhodothermales bacterium]
TIKEKAQTLRAFVDDAAPEHYREVLVPYLQSLRSAVDAHTVCLLKQSDDTIHHHIEAIVSLNAYARSGGDFSSKVPLVQSFDARSPAVIRKISDSDLPASGLGYYRESIAVKEVAVAPVPRPESSETYVLLADVMQEGGLNNERRRALVGHFARLLGAVIESVRTADIPEAYDYVRPRREIISEEIDRARKKKKPLALALVHLNEAEAAADQGDRQIKAAEKALATRIRQSARNARVERFGELTFGVFFQAPGTEVESWAIALQRDVDDDPGPLAGGISIGIAMLQERHQDADSFRQDATDALREAYESGTCTIVE